jgi:hypothetical protein
MRARHASTTICFLDFPDRYVILGAVFLSTSLGMSFDSWCYTWASSALY